MTRRFRGPAVWLVMVVETLGTARIARAQSPETPTIRLVIVNAAHIPREIQEAAQLETTRIYARIGVTLTWIDSAAIVMKSNQETREAISARRLTMIIVRNPLAGVNDSDGKLMGLATGTSEGRGTLAYAFYQRVLAFAWREEIGVAQALGYVMAHEIGHLLLPSNAHSSNGIMRADGDRLYMDRVARGEETFTPEQAALIRSVLRQKQ